MRNQKGYSQVSGLKRQATHTTTNKLTQTNMAPSPSPCKSDVWIPKKRIKLPTVVLTTVGKKWRRKPISKNGKRIKKRAAVSLKASEKRQFWVACHKSWIVEIDEKEPENVEIDEEEPENVQVGATRAIPIDLTECQNVHTRFT